MNRIYLILTAAITLYAGSTDSSRHLLGPCDLQPCYEPLMRDLWAPKPLMQSEGIPPNWVAGMWLESSQHTYEESRKELLHRDPRELELRNEAAGVSALIGLLLWSSQVSTQK